MLCGCRDLRVWVVGSDGVRDGSLCGGTGGEGGEWGDSGVRVEVCMSGVEVRAHFEHECWLLDSEGNGRTGSAWNWEIRALQRQGACGGSHAI